MVAQTPPKFQATSSNEETKHSARNYNTGTMLKAIPGHSRNGTPALRFWRLHHQTPTQPPCCEQHDSRNQGGHHHRCSCSDDRREYSSCVRVTTSSSNDRRFKNKQRIENSNLALLAKIPGCSANGGRTVSCLWPKTGQCENRSPTICRPLIGVGTKHEKHKRQNIKHKRQSTKHKRQNTKHKRQSTKHKIQNTKSPNPDTIGCPSRTTRTTSRDDAHHIQGGRAPHPGKTRTTSRDDAHHIQGGRAPHPGKTRTTSRHNGTASGGKGASSRARYGRVVHSTTQRSA